MSKFFNLSSRTSWQVFIPPYAVIRPSNATQNVVRSIVGGNKPEEDKGINEDKRKRDEDMVPRLLDFRNFAGRTLNDAFVDQAVVHMHNPSSMAATSATAPGFKSVPNKDFAFALTDAFQA